MTTKTAGAGSLTIPAAVLEKKAVTFHARMSTSGVTVMREWLEQRST